MFETLLIKWAIQDSRGEYPAVMPSDVMGMALFPDISS